MYNPHTKVLEMFVIVYNDQDDWLNMYRTLKEAEEALDDAAEVVAHPVIRLWKYHRTVEGDKLYYKGPVPKKG